MDTKTLKICVSDKTIMGGFEPNKKPRVVRVFFTIKRILGFINSIFVGSNIMSRPPTFSNNNLLNLETSLI